MGPFLARITFSFELSTPKLTFPPSFVNFPSGGPFPPSPPGLIVSPILVMFASHCFLYLESSNINFHESKLDGVQ